MTEQIIQVAGLKKNYGELVAVAGIDFTVNSGEIFAILGANGAGKTTTVELMAGLRKPDAGKVSIAGLDPQRDVRQVRQVVGVQLQQAQLQAKLRVHEALSLYASFYQNPRDIRELANLLGLEKKLDAPFQSLSGGFKQRLSIALALVGNPQIAILDELTTGLDPQSRHQTWDVIKQIQNQGVTIILVTHFMDEVENLADRLIVIDQGKIIARGTPSELVSRNESQRVVQIALTDIPDTSWLQHLSGVVQVEVRDKYCEVRGDEKVLATVVMALAERGVYPRDLRTAPGNLEEAFLELLEGRSSNV